MDLQGQLDPKAPPDFKAPLARRETPALKGSKVFKASKVQKDRRDQPAQLVLKGFKARLEIPDLLDRPDCKAP